MTTTSSATEQRTLAQFYGDLESNDLQPLWTQSHTLMPAHPAPRTRAWLWKWDVLEALGQRAGELISIHHGGDRRVLSLSNPGLDGAPFATSTLWAAIQYLRPGESAPGHRHTPGAVRFVLDGGGVWTTVDGDACDMRQGDLVLTPSWTWHDHTNSGDRPMVWFDGLDLPTVIGLDAVFFEPYSPEELQPVRGHNLSERIYGGRSSMARTRAAATPNSPLLVYRWSDTAAMLDSMTEDSDEAEVVLEYVNPTTGGSVLPTLACEMHRLAPVGPTHTRRKVGSSVFVVFHGSGHSVIDGVRFDWQRGDIFAVPSWAAVCHESTETSDLFAISDAPTMRALNLFREASDDTNQEVVSTFRPRT